VDFCEGCKTYWPAWSKEALHEEANRIRRQRGLSEQPMKMMGI
jgi:hypothetical protein